jgi:hydrogenase maturation protein HypF
VQETVARVCILIRGAVQGVGFRPFVYRLAVEIGVAGWVSNSGDGLCIEAEGLKDALDCFLIRLHREHPPHASIHSLEYSYLDAVGYADFEIRESQANTAKNTVVLPDIATCADCIRDIFEPSNRRYLYPFTNCTNCGPRFTIIERIPYDRSNTTMQHFSMCRNCRQEYEDPLDRRFHAQPNACAECGPQMELWDEAGKIVAPHETAIDRAAEGIRNGLIVAVKGIGGLHLMADSTNDAAIRRLRERKYREEKPFALMAASIESIRYFCFATALEERALSSPEAPIVLLSRHERSGISNSVAPQNPYLGVMLPSSPLHHILLQKLSAPVVATSGNRSDEPIAIDEREALRRLHGIADLFLVHNRPIRRHVDDSIVRIILGQQQILRRARGYAPLPLMVRRQMPERLAVGGHMKNTVALAKDDKIFLSQHVGDLETKEAFDAFRRVIDDFQDLFEIAPASLAGDLHPEYASSAFAGSLSEKRSIPFEPIQHHWGHVLSCMTENELEPPVLGVAWDGTGYGADGTIWGGEFLLAHGNGFQRVAHLRTFPLPGGDAAARNPKQAAAGLLYEIFGSGAFSGDESPLLRQMLEKGLRSPRTSSAGRLFDAVASLIGLRDHCSFEGQAAMQLEFAAAPNVTVSYPYAIDEGDSLILDWEPMIQQIIKETQERVPIGLVAAKFHNTLAEMIVDIARRLRPPKVVLTGGCFQNRYLTERTVQRLRESRFAPHWHQRVPPNDGGLALGQVVAASAAERRQSIDFVDSYASQGLNVQSTQSPGSRRGVYSVAAPRLQT